MRVVGERRPILTGAGEPGQPLTPLFRELMRSHDVILFAAEVGMALSQGLESGVVNQSSQAVYCADSRNRDDRDCRASVRSPPAAPAAVQGDEVASEVDLYATDPGPPVRDKQSAVSRY